MNRKGRLLEIAFLLPILAPHSLSLLAAGCGTAASQKDEPLGSNTSALTGEQCLYFDVNGKNLICHHTGSSSHPYTIVKTSNQACIDGHAGHTQDYIAVNDPTCNGGGCLPVQAPCDATVPCCDRLACTDGTCGCAPGWTGTNCETDIDECASSPCLSGDCEDLVNGYTCHCLPHWTGTNCDTCAPGWTGTHCETDIDECASNPCVNGECEDQVNGYTCICLPGWTGTNCEVPTPPI